MNSPSRLPALLSHLFLHFIPSLLLSLLAYILAEAAHLTSRAAEALQTAARPLPHSLHDESLRYASAETTRPLPTPPRPIRFPRPPTSPPRTPTPDLAGDEMWAVVDDQVQLANRQTSHPPSNLSKSSRDAAEEGPASPQLSPSPPSMQAHKSDSFGTPPSPTVFKMLHHPLARHSLDLSAGRSVLSALKVDDNLRAHDSPPDASDRNVSASSDSSTPVALRDTMSDGPAREYVRMNRMMCVSSTKKSTDDVSSSDDLQADISEDDRHENIPEELDVFPTSLSDKFASLTSAPESPIQKAVQGRLGKTWRASDHDLFSEDPMSTHDNFEQTSVLQPSNKVTANSITPPLVDGTRFRQTLVEDYDSAAMIVGVRCVDTEKLPWFNEDTFSASTPVTNPYADRSDWSSDYSANQARQSKSCDASSDSSDSILTRDASVEEIVVNSPVLDDRPRGSKDAERQLGPRRITCRMPSKPGVTAKSGRPLPNPRVGRSLSSGENRGEEWPEYSISAQDDATRMGRRHASDMSFGVKARKQDMLPVDVLNEQMQDDGDYMENRQGGLTERLAGRGWKKRLGLTGGREANDMKLAFRNILRRRKRSNLGVVNSDGGAQQRLGTSQRLADRAGRRGMSEVDVKFECELIMDTVFPLLNRICSEAGYKVVVKRPNYKMKIEVPWGDGENSMLISINLTRMSHGRGTVISMARSREDQFRGPSREIKETASVIRKRLAAQVEVLDDSFASLYFEDSMIDLDERRIVVEDARR